MTNHYHTTEPTLVSVSGGRTSGMMLRETIAAHGGSLPSHVLPMFANTGKERRETLDFVEAMSAAWGVKIVWIEWRPKASYAFPYPDERSRAAKWWRAATERCGEAGFEIVDHKSASRFGEPFAALIAHKKAVPNWQARWCTGELKVKIIKAYLQSIGWTSWINMIGLRFDEKGRVSKKWEQNAAGKDPWQSLMPLYRSGVTKADVMTMWAAQPFDLALKSDEGNCDCCFLKGKRKLVAIIRRRPSAADWWIGGETGVNATFSSRHSYADLKAEATSQIDMFDEPANDNEESDAECGDTCAYDGYEEDVAA